MCHQGRNQQKISRGRSHFWQRLWRHRCAVKLDASFCYDQLTNTDGGTFFIVGGVRASTGEQNGRFLPPWKLGYESNMSRKPEVNSLIPILIELILAHALKVYFPVWHSHCTWAKFTVLVLCRDELLTVHSCPLTCQQRQFVKLGNGLFYFWPLQRNNNMATNIQRFTSSCGNRCFAACDCWTQASWQVRQRDSDCW